MKKVSPIMRRHRIFSIIFGILLLVVLGFILYSISTNYLDEYSLRTLIRLRQKLAIAGAFLFAGAGILFCIRVFLKYSTPRGFGSFSIKINLKVSEKVSKEFLEGNLIKSLRAIAMVLGRIAQNLHVIFASLGTMAISLHVYISFHLGFVFTLGYIAGLIALILLIILLITSVRRIFNKSIKGHKWLGILFIIFMGIHILLI